MKKDKTNQSTNVSVTNQDERPAFPDHVAFKSPPTSHTHRMVYILIVAIVLAFVGCLGVRMHDDDHKSSAKTTAGQSTQKLAKPVATGVYNGWALSSLNYEQYSFKYPTSWKLDNTFQPHGVNSTVTPGSDTVQLISPTGLLLTMNTGVTSGGNGFGQNISSKPIKTLGGSYYLDFYTTSPSNSSLAQGACVGRLAATGATYPLSKNIQAADSRGAKPFDQVCLSYKDQNGNIIAKPVSTFESDGSLADAELIIESLAPTPSTNPYVSWKTYSNEQAGMTFKYPATWSSQATTEASYSNGSFAGVSGTLTSASGNKLTWVYQVIGGKGDAGCTPSTGDVAFAVGDNCASKQILSVEQIQSVKSPSGAAFRDLFEDNLYITETKYNPGRNGIDPTTGEPDSATTYQICLDPQFNAVNSAGLAPPQVGTTTGFELPCEYWDTGFNASFQVKNQADFNSSDAQTAKQIMRSFNSL